jgi:hypothetical protein
VAADPSVERIWVLIVVHLLMDKYFAKNAGKKSRRFI